MKYFVAVIVLLAVWAGSVGAVDLATEARIDRQAVRSASIASVGGAGPQNLSCVLPGVLPVSPPNGLAAGTFTAAWSTTDAFVVTVWREPCATGFTTYVRAVPTAGTPFVCSSAFVVLQNLTQYDFEIVRTSNGLSFCDDLLAPVTFAIDQYSFQVPFDQSAPFALVYKGVYVNYQGNIASSNGTPARTWLMVELTPTEEGDMRGALNFYVSNLTQPFYRLVLEERTYERYRTLAQQLGMAIPPPR